MVLELTLKHLNALTAVTEQQHQKIIALQNGKLRNNLYRQMFEIGIVLNISEMYLKDQ